MKTSSMAENWQRQNRPFCGLIFSHLIVDGQGVKDLELIAKATDPQDWVSVVERLPL